MDDQAIIHLMRGSDCLGERGPYSITYALERARKMERQYPSMTVKVTLPAASHE